ncbi:MAG: hypothetical protein QOG62_663 [Thermoleophilaceae bacterium]|nr:hypothetical protein [Thermoleophilaceae bacterium]
MSGPRIAPGTRAEIGRVNYTLARLIGAAGGSGPPNVFTTLARHKSLFRKWLRFAGALMPGGLLPRDESELLILRVAHNCDSEYERSQHVRLGLEAGLTEDEIAAIGGGPGQAGLSPRRRLLLRTADELHTTRTVSQETWNALAALYSRPELIEICMLVGHYEMLAMTLNALAVEPDAPAPGPPPRAMGIAQRALRRGRTNERNR